MRSNYERALSYAWKCCPPLYKDIVHEAYLRHYKKDGTNLFDRDIYVVIVWVRNVWFNIIREGKYMKDGVYYQRYFYDASDMNLTSGISPDRELMSKEFYEELFKRVDNYSNEYHKHSIDPKTLRQFLNLVNDGWTYPEICEKMGMSAQRIHYYKLKIQKIINEMENTNNPFAGSTVKIKKKITRKTYEEKYKDEYKYNPEKDCDVNEWFMIVTNGDDYMLVKENFKD